MKVWRWVLIPFGIVVLLLFLGIAVGPAWLNTFIHSESFKQEVETRAAQSLGGTVQIDSIDFSIFSGVKLHGLVTQMDAAHADGQGEIAANIEDVNCRYSLWQLLQRRLALTAVTLDKPQIVLTRQPPSEVQPPEPANPPAAGTSPSPPTTPGGNAAPFQFVLEALNVNDGALSVRDAAGASIAELHGIQVAAKTAGFVEGGDVTGRIKIDQITLPPNVMITSFSTPFTYRPGMVQVNPFDAAAFNGWLAGDYQLGATGPSLLDVNAKGVDVAQLAQAVGSSSPGKISGSLDLQSKWRGVETGQVDGEGDAQLHDGRLEGMPLLHELAEALRVKELESPNLKQVQTHFQVAGGRTHFTGLQIDAGIFQMTGDGTVFPGGGLSADMVLIFPRDSMNRIPKEVAMFFVQRQDGSASIAFHLGGTLDRPQTDLATRVFLQAAPVQNALNKALDRFFHKHKSSNASPAPAPAPAPEASAPSTATPSGPVSPPANP